MTYVGPGDIKSFTGWWGLRAYSAATCGTACADISATAGGSVTTINTLANGNFDVASAVAALGGNNGFIAKLYDQTGGAKHLVQATGASQPKITLNALQGGTLPEIDMTGVVQFSTSRYMLQPTFTVTNPWSIVAVVNPTGNWHAARNFLGCDGTNAGGGAQGLSWASATTFQFLNAGFSGPAARTWAASSYHRVIGVQVNSSSALTSLDSSVVTFTGGTNAWTTAGIGFGDANGSFDIKAVEFGVAASAFNSTDAGSLDTNINNYWFVAVSAPAAGLGGHAPMFAPLLGPKFNEFKPQLAFPPTFISGTLAVTETPDTAVLNGFVGVSGSLSSTESTDIAAFAGDVAISGTFATTEAPDTILISGSVIVSGNLVAADTTDTAAFNGDVVVSGTLAVTDTTDTASFNGTVGNAISGALATTEAIDVAAFAGSVVVSGSFLATEAADTASFSGGVLVSGTFAATEAVDIAAFAGSVTSQITGTFAVTESPDTCDFESGFLVGGSYRWKKWGYPEVSHVNSDVKKSATILATAGGHARAASLTARQRSNIASIAAKVRWK